MNDTSEYHEKPKIVEKKPVVQSDVTFWDQLLKIKPADIEEEGRIRPELLQTALKNKENKEKILSLLQKRIRKVRRSRSEDDDEAESSSSSSSEEENDAEDEQDGESEENKF